ncbi:SAM-dependent methyltransferase [Nocardia asteroides]|uniref:SAM-dependent methyltransferase n=1 Tax=Nocardia asteroides TaxID=1824 RepID=UPI003646C236
MADRDIVLDQHIPSSARVGNKLLGGKDNYEADEIVVSRLSEHFVVAVRQSRLFLLRAVDYLCTEHQVYQYVDLGCGIPISPDIGDIAGHHNNRARVLSIDYDLLVAVHARALLETSPGRRFALLDVTDTAAVLDQITTSLDLSAPMAICLSGTAELLPHAPAVLAVLTRGLPPGTWIILSHITDDENTQAIRDSAYTLARQDLAYHPRDRGTLTAMLAPYRLLGPGLVAPHRWNPFTEQTSLKPQHPITSASLVSADSDLSAYAAIGQLPH